MQLEFRGLLPLGVRLALLTLVMVAVHDAAESAGRFGAPGLRLFAGMIGINLAAVLLLGTGVFANAISEEKEAQTLGLLRMSALSNSAIILGKAGGGLLAFALLLAVQLPFAVLCVTLGGVTATQILSAYASLFAVLCFVANLGLFWSVVCRSTRRAQFMTSLFLFLIVLAPVFLRAISPNREFRTLIRQYFQYVLPADRLESMTRGRFDGTIIHSSMWACLLGGAVLFLFALILFRRCSIDRPPSEAPMRIKSLGRVWNRPVIWQTYYFAMRERMSGALRLLGLIVLGFTAVAMLYIRPGLRDTGETLLFIGLWVLAIDLALGASRLFGIEREQGVWSSLYGSQQSLSSIVGQKLLACLLALAPALVVTGVGLLLSGEFPGMLDDRDFWWGAGVACCSLLSVIWLSLYPRRPPIASTAGAMILLHVLLLAAMDRLGWYSEKETLAVILFAISIRLVFLIRARLHTLASQ